MTEKKKNKIDIPDDVSNKDFYTAYISQLEDNISKLMKINKEYEEKLNKLTEIENANRELTIVNLQYKKFKKMAYKFNDIHTMTCSNPKCIANNVALLQLQKNYDKLLIENSKLKQENLAYKYNI